MPLPTRTPFTGGSTGQPFPGKSIRTIPKSRDGRPLLNQNRIQGVGTMKETVVKELKEDIPALRDPVMIVGLPGVGNIGKLAADYLKDLLGAEPVLEIVSPHFPPQVMSGEDSTIRIVKNQICLAETEKRSVVLLVGEAQSTDGPGHYELSDLYTDLAARFGVKQIYTLGGYPIGIPAEPHVVGVVTDVSQKEFLEQQGVEFRKCEPPGGIIGAAALVLYFAAEKGIPAACLTGTTTGYIADPRCAKKIAGVLGKILETEIPENALDDRIEEVEKLVEQLKPHQAPQVPRPDDDLAYYG